MTMTRSDQDPPAQRVMAYCHDSVGLGHFHRTLAICERVVRQHPPSTFLLTTGTPYVPIFNLPKGVDYVKLPALAKLGRQTYRGKFLKTSIRRIICCREGLLLSTAQTLAPHVLLVDKAPAGVCGELLPTLRWLRRHLPQTRIIFGMRDIEDDPHTTIAQWNESGSLRALEECYDEIWVYGMRSVFDVTTEYRLPLSVQNKLRFLGYVVQDPCAHRIAESGSDVLVTVGGGTDGGTVLKTFLNEAAERLSGRGLGSTIVGGPDLPRPDAEHLSHVAARLPGVEWLDCVPCLSCRIRQASVVVSMGGYNTLCEVVSNRKPAVVIPRTTPRVEQAIRARLWSRRAALDVIAPEELTPAALADRVIHRLENRGCAPAVDLDFGGLHRVSERFEAFYREDYRRAAPLRV